MAIIDVGIVLPNPGLISIFKTFVIDEMRTCSDVFEPPEPFNPVIDNYIMPMIAEIVRDQIALIIIGELNNHKTLAENLAATQPETLVGKQALWDLENGVYDVLSNFFIEKGTKFDKSELPGINIYYNRSDYPADKGDAINRQVANASYTIEAHITAKHKQKNDEIKYGDEKAARVAARIIGLIRAIIMSGQYVRLGYSTQDNVIWQRWVNSVDVFQPDYQENDAVHGTVGILNATVMFNEIGPAISGEILQKIITGINVKLRTADNGKVISMETTGG